MFKAKWECKLKSLVIIGMLLTILTMIKLITDAIIDENSQNEKNQSDLLNIKMARCTSFFGVSIQIGEFVLDITFLFILIQIIKDSENQG